MDAIEEEIGHLGDIAIAVSHDIDEIEHLFEDLWVGATVVYEKIVNEKQKYS